MQGSLHQDSPVVSRLLSMDEEFEMLPICSLPRTMWTNVLFTMESITFDMLFVTMTVLVLKPQVAIKGKLQRNNCGTVVAMPQYWLMSTPTSPGCSCWGTSKCPPWRSPLGAGSIGTILICQCGRTRSRQSCDTLWVQSVTSADRATRREDEHLGKSNGLKNPESPELVNLLGASIYVTPKN